MSKDIMLVILVVAMVLGVGCEQGVQGRLQKSSTKRLAFIHSTDVHGHIKASRYNTVDTRKNYTVGGLAGVSAILKVIQEEQEGQALVVDSGDQFTGSLLSQYFNGSSVTAMFNNLGYNATVFGNHEFDLTQPNLQARILQSAFPWVSSNLANKTQGAEFYDDASVKTQVLMNKGVKVGVVGLTTVKTYFTTAGDLSEVMIDEHYVNITHHYARLLREQQGCQVVIVTGHLGSRIDPTYHDPNMYHELYQYGLREAHNSTNYPLETGRFASFLDRLDPTLVDAVLAGHTHNMLHQFTAQGIPVLITECYAKYVQVLYLDYDTILNQVVRRQIEGPVPVCSQVFSQKGICDVNIEDNSESSNGPLVDYSLHGHVLRPDQTILELIKPYQKIINQKYPSNQLGFIERAMIRDRTKEATMQNFITDALAWKSGADVAIVNSGMIRIDWPVGAMYYQRIFETIPFDNNVVTVPIDGATLRRAVTDINQGELGFYGMSNLQITVQDRKVVKVLWYNHDRQLVELEDTRVYSMALPGFLLEGGDDFHRVIEYFHPDPKDIVDWGVAREAISDYVQLNNKINSIDNPVINPSQPRIILINPSQPRVILINPTL